MRKFYTLLALLIAFFSGLEANAQRITLNIPTNYEHVSAYLNDPAYPVYIYGNGSTVVSPMNYGLSGDVTCYITPEEGYQISISGPLTAGPSTKTLEIPITINDWGTSYTVNVEAADDPATPKSKIKLCVATDYLNPSNVISELRLGDQYLDAALYYRYTDVQFDPETENTLTLVTKNGYYFDAATLDREVSAGDWQLTDLEYKESETDPYSYIYTIELKDGDMITFNDPISLKPANASFTFNYGDVDASAVIRSFTNGAGEAIDAADYAEGDHEISFIADTQKKFTLTTKDNYIFSTATLNGNAINSVETSGVAGSYTYSFDVNEGDKVVFADPVVRKVSKANFTFTYDGFAYTDVVSQFRNSSVNLGPTYAAPGKREIEFDDPTGKTFTIVTKGDHKFDVATVNGKTIEAADFGGITGYYQYVFDVEDGDEVVFEIKKVVVKHYINFTYTNPGTENAVEYVTRNYNRVELAPQIEFEEGDGIEIKFYNSGLILDKVTVNDEELTINSYGEAYYGNTYPQPQPKTDLNVVITAHLPAMMKVNVNVSNASHVELYNVGYSYQCSDNNRIQIEDGENEVEIPETNKNIFIKPTLPSGWELEVKDEEGTVYSIPSYGKSVLGHEGMTLNIKTYDPSDIPPFTVYTFVSNPESVKKFTDKQNNNLKDELKEGYSEMTVNAVQNPFNFDDAVIYLNNEKLVAGFLGTEVTLKEDDFLMIFGGGDAPDTHNVSLTTEDNVEYTVFKHHKYEAEDPSSIDMLEGTELLIVPAKGHHIVVTPTAAAVAYDAREGNSDIITNEDGSYVVKVNANTKNLTVAKNNALGISEILDSVDEDAVVYNLQGLRVNAKNLPAGIYVVNGKKVMIRK
ncbi:MAG: hypothetical protein HDS97_01095 [Bacteroidales bacterium]|nr:hypothetical protein [Bacteroidales bacterium]